jgi:hypothetical protein
LVLFNTIAVAVPALFYLGVAFTPADQPILVVLMFSIIFMLLSANGAGFYKCGALYSRYLLPP